ncbi:hypothetical protein PPERSA_02139 [Pseudocohnilembus persalinus]|uniref:VWFA domain-containing protein n=1 Tax=Pseudocohnilembus persalinus TaxID=266149 RepID=A0A0V0Q7K6_PSEPJ|nr:hypothetical protein PPERSA_02139 [Pseudocohnilembus persalinus]|eukprot:KRW98161.1 hypothetical protein PPERSA_02139 [Pseudocohnilembus persalinus]
MEIEEKKTDEIFQTVCYTFPQNYNLQNKIKFQFRSNNLIQNDSNNKTKRIKDFILVIDKSGSMSGSYIMNTISTYKLIGQYVQQKQCKDLTLIYLTDGQGQSDGSIFNDMKNYCKSLDNLEVYTIGLGAGHDPKILYQLNSIASQKSAYKYIKVKQNQNQLNLLKLSFKSLNFPNTQEINDIGVCFEAIADIMDENNYQFILSYLNDQQQKQQQIINFNKDDDGLYSKVLGFQDFLKIIKQNENQDLQTLLNNNQCQIILKIIKNNKEFLSFPIKQVQIQELNEQQHLFEIQELENTKFSESINVFLDQILLHINGQDKKYLNENKEQVLNKVKDALINSNELIKQAFKIKKSKKEPAFKQLSNLQNRLRAVQQVLFKFYNNEFINSSMIAEVNEMKYSNIQSKIIQKKLQKRVGATTQIFEQNQKNIETLSKEIAQNKDEIAKDNQQIIEDIQCFLSCNNFLEALMDEDCLCISLSVSRTEISIVRPECLKIENIYPTVISAKSFIMAVKHALKISPEKSGGFIKKQGEIIKGTANEYINAAFPIFINPIHWKVASLWLEPILGWVTTLDPMGYHHSQKRTVPFLILDKIIQMLYENPNSEFLEKIYDQVKITCLKIMSEDEESQKAQLQIENSQAHESIRKELLSQLESLLKIGVAKLNQDHISNLKIFTIKLALALELNWISIDDLNNVENYEKLHFKHFYELRMFILEEHLRRTINKAWTVNQINSLILHKQQTNECLVDLLEQIYLPSNISLFILLQSFDIQNKEFEQNLSFKKVINIIEKIQQLKSQDITQEQLLKKMLNFDQQEQLLTYFSQNRLQQDSKVRKNTIATKKFFNPWNLQECQDFMQETKKLAENEQLLQQYYQEMQKKKATHVKGRFMFCQPKIACKNKVQLIELLKQYNQSNNQKEYETILKQMKPLKSNPRFYFWYLVSNNAIDIDKKVLTLGKLFGKIPLTNYNMYQFEKSGQISIDILNQIKK